MATIEFVTGTGTKRADRTDRVVVANPRHHADSQWWLSVSALATVVFLFAVAPLRAAQPVRDSVRSLTQGGAGSDSVRGTVLARSGDSAPSFAASVLPYGLAEKAVLHAPGTSRFAGDHVGAATVESVLEALCAASAGTVTGVQHFASDSNAGAILLLRSTRTGNRRFAWHEVLVYHLDQERHINAMELYVEDQRAWDKRFPREDGVLRVSVVTERNVAAARERVREARFVAGNGNHVLAVVDVQSDAMVAGMGVRRTTLVEQTIAPSGAVRATARFAPMALATTAGVWVARY